MKTPFVALAFLLLFCSMTVAQSKKQNPLKVGVARLTHDHVHELFNRPKDVAMELVGIYEPDRSIAEKYAKQYGFELKLVYENLDEMLEKSQPEAVMAYGSIFEHLEVVEACAPRKIDVMVEKPLAINMDHARKMKKLVDANGIKLLTNFETTWYASNQKAYETVVKNKEIGKIRKVVVHDGHEGPKEIGVSDAFFSWLTDPEKNGGGAVVDFGCYGANLLTWMMKGQKPEAVVGVTHQNKPDIYPKVDDEATIVLQYPEAQGIIQASWNWPFSRKDMEVYGQTGLIMADNSRDVRIRKKGEDQPVGSTLSPRKKPYGNPFSFLVAVVRGDIKLAPYDLSSLENNMIVVEILEAARKSAKEGKSVKLDPA